MQYTHKCNNAIYLIQPYTLVSTFGISSEGVRPYGGTLELKSNKDKLVYYCPKCGELENLKDVKGYCYECREYFDISELYYYAVNGGTFCEKCAKLREYNTDKRRLISLLTILNKKGNQ